MGCFAYCCLGCGWPCLDNDKRSNPQWMTDIVGIDPRGNLHTGGVNHYGHGFDGGLNLEYFALYHKTCYRKMGSPKKFFKPSPWAFDQGFVDQEWYPQKPPRSLLSYKRLWGKYRKFYLDFLNSPDDTPKTQA